MKLSPVSVSQLTYLETGQFIIRFLTDFEGTGTNPATDAEFNALLALLKIQSPVYNDALMQIRAKAESEMLLQLDEKRDQKVVTVRRALYVYEYIDAAAEKAAFNSLKIVLRNFNGIEKANFEAESLGVYNMIKELRTATNLPLVKLLNMEVHVNNLETANNTFKTTFDKRSSDTVSTKVYDTRALRKNILNTYGEIAEYIYVMAKRKNTAYYTGILDAINNGREYFADIIARREGSAKVAVTPTPTV